MSTRAATPGKNLRRPVETGPRGTGIRPYEKGDDFLYYVGCVGAYDERSRVNARAVGELFRRAGCSFGILGSEEVCDGNEVKHLGERGLFEYLVQEQSRIFGERGVKKVVTLSPHAFHTMKNDYPGYGVNVQVMHYTRFLRDLIETGKLDVSRGLTARVTFHDPVLSRKMEPGIRGAQTDPDRHSRDRARRDGEEPGDLFLLRWRGRQLRDGPPVRARRACLPEGERGARDRCDDSCRGLSDLYEDAL